VRGSGTLTNMRAAGPLDSTFVLYLKASLAPRPPPPTFAITVLK